MYFNFFIVKMTTGYATIDSIERSEIGFQQVQLKFSKCCYGTSIIKNKWETKNIFYFFFFFFFFFFFKNLVFCRNCIGQTL